jgi:hypothetical protein
MTEELQNDGNSEQDSFTNLDPATLAPELQEIYKNMQAGFTKKTTEFADREKAFTAREQKWEEDLKKFGAVDAENKKWHSWYQNLQEQDPEEETTQTQETQLPDESQEINPDLRKYLDDFQTTQSSSVNNLQQEVENLKAALRNSTDQTSRMFNYQSQLGELEKEYEDLDKQKVLDHALKLGQPDLKKAYSDLYHDDLIEHEVQKRLKEAMTKQRTQGIRSNAQQVVVRTKENAPKSFAEATEQIARSL